MVLPENERVESVHYLDYPVPNEKLYNLDIERTVNRTKNIIQLGRQARDKATMAIKQPLTELTVFHKDPQYIKDILVLESFIKDEVNIKKIVIKNEGFEDSIKLKAIPDKSRLGKRLRKDFAKVESEILALPREKLEAFELEGKMVIQGFEIFKEDVTLSNEFSGSGTDQKAAWNEEALIVLNLELDEALKLEGTFREIANRIQRLRKKAGLDPTESGITAIYKLGAQPAKNAAAKLIEDALHQYAEQILKKTKCNLVPLANKVENPIASEETKIGGVSFGLQLARLG